MAKLAELFETEIPAGRGKLKESCANLVNVASHCEENYVKAENKKDALAETRQYATQALASVAYQINMLATSILQMLDLQGVQLADMEMSTNHLARSVSAHKEKVSRREIGVLTKNKNCIRTHKIVAPANPEKPIKYKSVPIDFGTLDNIGHGLKITDPSKAPGAQKRKESLVSPSSPAVDNFPIFNPDARPPNSPSECDLYATVRKTPMGSPKSVRQYRSPKAGPQGGTPSPPPPPPAGPDIPHPPPPPEATFPLPPMPEAPDSALTPPVMAPPPSFPKPPPGPKVAGQEKATVGGVAAMMMMPPPPPPDMVMPPNEGASVPPPPPMDDTPYPANMGITDEEMPPPPEFVQAGDTDQSAPADYIEKVIAIYGYEKNLDDELTFQEDDIIYVLNKNPNGWYEGILNGVKGMFPGNYVQTVP
ncbi:abl interactor 2-like [Acanthaster planci]|uniref:Abl interactor 2-like n=1 Tax=Acanthaster planci TaxID=133434 RepID=A0A8B7ZYY9_ACAPL|nr:abl interactor 2-like [Acanthaster planci]